MSEQKPSVHQPERSTNIRTYDVGILYRRFYCVDLNPKKDFLPGLAKMRELSKLRDLSLPEIEETLSSQDSFTANFENIARKSPNLVFDLAYLALLTRLSTREEQENFFTNGAHGQEIGIAVRDIKYGDEYALRTVRRLYCDIFNREADQDGEQIYVDQIKAGRSVRDIAWEFRSSAEYADMPEKTQTKLTFFGQPIEKAFQEAAARPQVERTHRNKTYDLADLYLRFTYEEFDLAKGKLPADQSLIQAVADGKYFVEIEDAVARHTTYRQIAANYLKLHSPMAVVDKLYKAILDRQADSEGQAIYTGQIKDGRPVQDVLRELLASAEYRNRIIRRIYHEILERDPDPEDLKIYVDQLGKGRTVSKIVAEMEASEEYQNMHGRENNKIVFSGIPVDILFFPKVKANALKENAKAKKDHVVSAVKNASRNLYKSVRH